MLGTGNALVTECYNTCFVLSEGDRHFLVDGGGGNTVLRQLKRAGIDWKSIKDIFVTHGHVDHLLGIIWMVRMICQYMRQGEYEGEANIYAHEELISLLNETAHALLPEKDTRFIGRRLHLTPVADGGERQVIGRKTVFSTSIPPRRSSLALPSAWETEKDLPAAATSLTANMSVPTPKRVSGSCTRPFACTRRLTYSIPMKKPFHRKGRRDHRRKAGGEESAPLPHGGQKYRGPQIALPGGGPQIF